MTRTRRDVGRRRWDAVKTVLAWTAPVLLLVSGVIGYVALDTAQRAQSDAREFRDDDRRQIDLTRRAAWRLCERNMRDRALAHSLVGKIGSPRRRQVEEMNPIVNCDPNLVGKPATPLTHEGQRAFVRLWELQQVEPLPEPPGRAPGLRR